MNALRVAAIAAIAFTVTGTSIEAQQGTGQGRGRQQGDGQMSGQGEKGRGRARGYIFKGVELTESQKAQIRTVAEKYRTERQAMMQANRPSDGARAKPDSAQRARMQDLMTREHAEMRAILTPAQQPAFDRNVAAMRTRHSEAANGRKRGQGERGKRGRGNGN